MIEALPDGRLHARASEPPGPLGFGQLRDATLARTCSACRSVNGGSAIGSAVGRMQASRIASCRRQRAHYRRTGTVAPIPLPTQNSHQSNRSPIPSARPRGNGSRDLSKTERADLMAKSPSGDEVLVQ